MYELFAMNNAGTEFLISHEVKRSDMAGAMQMIAKAGLIPYPKRINASSSAIIGRALDFYLH